MPARAARDAARGFIEISRGAGTVGVRMTRTMTTDATSAHEWDGRVEAWEALAASEPFLRMRDRVCRLAAPQPDDVVVDLGAGTGLLALSLAPAVERVVAVDSSPRMLERLAERAEAGAHDNVTAVVGDLRELPLEDESVTLAVSNYAFHHLDGCGKGLALSEVRRVLRPGGRLVVCDMMFSLSLRPRDRRLLVRKVASIARRGPAGWLRIARNAGRVAAGRWEHPAPAEEWLRLLGERRFEAIETETLAHEAGIACARRPLRP